MVFPLIGSTNVKYIFPVILYTSQELSIVNVVHLLHLVYLVHLANIVVYRLSNNFVKSL